MVRHKKTRGFIAVFIIFIIVAIGFFMFDMFFSVPQFNQSVINQFFKQDQDYCYFYEKLNDQEKENYKTIFYGVSKHQEEIALSNVSVEQIQSVLEKVLYDHPELYYVNNQFQYQDMHRYMNFIPQYDYSQSEVEKFNKQIIENTKQIMASAKKEKDSMLKAKKIYDFVIEKNEYQTNQKTDQNIISSLIEGKTVCAGYARAYQYIMNRVGEKCAYIIGVANESKLQTRSGEGHAWTMLEIENDYYYCDPTWGDYAEKGDTHACNGYFMMNSQEMLICYKPETAYEETKAQKLNYFKTQSSYMTSYNKKTLSHAIALGLNNKSRVAEIKCGSRDVYNTIKNKLETTYLGYEILNENQCYSSKARYSCDDNLLLIEIYY